MYRRIRLCSNRGGYEAVPEPPQPIDLGLAKARLEAERIPVVDARVMLIVRIEPEVTLSHRGRLLFKTQDPQLAVRAFERLRSIPELPPMEDAPGSEALGG